MSSASEARGSLEGRPVATEAAAIPFEKVARSLLRYYWFSSGLPAALFMDQTKVGDRAVNPHLVSEADAQLFQQGTHCRLQEKLGAHPVTVKGVSGVTVRRLGTQRGARQRHR